MKPEETYKKLFLHMTTNEPHKGVAVVVVTRIQRSQLMQTRTRAGAHSFFVLATLIGLAPAGQQLFASATSSGFIQFASLGWSDGVSVLGSWKAFIFTMIESAPILEMSIVLGLVLTCTYSLRRSAYYFAKLSTRKASSYATA
ncbi:MAG: hypothetical protein V4524_00210 [Patescibacteria group bacterium]